MGSSYRKEINALEHLAWASSKAQAGCRFSPINNGLLMIRLQHLDMLRGLASLGVVIGHARSFTLVPYADALNHDLAAKAVYALGGLGHVCVMIFFALSGFLVGGSSLAAMQRGQFFWRAYAAARLSRLWTVLVPALALTAVLDAIGYGLAPTGAYEGAFHALLSSGPSPTIPTTHALRVLIGNLLFLQTILVPVFGSNGPLWSLAYEAWYYLTFPLIAYGVCVAQGAGRIAFIAAGIIILLLLPISVVSLGIPWVAGALVAKFPDRDGANVRLARASFWSLLTLASLAYAALAKTLGGDILLGCVVAVWLRDLAVLPSLGGIYACAAHSLSEISYSLYAVHFPLLALLWFWLLAPLQRQPGVTAALQIAFFVAAALCYAAVTWLLFERRTERVRLFFMRLLAPTAGAQLSGTSE